MEAISAGSRYRRDDGKISCPDGWCIVELYGRRGIDSAATPSLTCMS
jgi:hypothetical protein